MTKRAKIISTKKKLNLKKSKTSNVIDKKKDIKNKIMKKSSKLQKKKNIMSKRSKNIKEEKIHKPKMSESKTLPIESLDLKTIPISMLKEIKNKINTFLNDQIRTKQIS